jgi:hypothetical protein
MKNRREEGHGGFLQSDWIYPVKTKPAEQGNCSAGD